jgi:flagellar biosynthesis GTPase FlhF
MEFLDMVAFAVFALGLCVMFLCIKPKEQKLYSRERPIAQPDIPTEGQVAFIRRFNNGILPVGLTKAGAAEMIKTHLAKMSAISKRKRVDISPVEFMSESKSYRERMKIERERRRAREKLERQLEHERRQHEREALREKKAVDRLYEKRIAEEEKLIKARKDTNEGVAHKARNAKAQTIQELQNLVNDILADKKIEPQEVRQLKAWLMANKQSPDDFAQMLRLIDESLVDGIIDETETQAIYEGVIDCLITLRERRSV